MKILLAVLSFEKCCFGSRLTCGSTLIFHIPTCTSTPPSLDHHVFLCLLVPPAPRCPSLSSHTHTHWQLLADRGPAVFSADSAVIAISLLLNNSLQTLLSEQTHTCTGVQFIPIHRHMCYTYPQTVTLSGTGTHRQAVHSHTHTHWTVLVSNSLCKMGQWGDFITSCKSSV